MLVTGACHCGAIRFAATVDPSRVVVCHCADCQVLTGTAYRVVVPAPVETFQLHGEPKRYVRTGDSGAKRVQAFCPECGTPLFAVALEGARQVSLRVGVLDQRAQLKPSLQIWMRSALPWAESLTGVAGCEQQELFGAR